MNLIDCAAKRKKADLVIKGGFVVNVFTGKCERGDVAICEGKIAGIGFGYEAETTICAENQFVLPGLIDGHIHVESTMLSPEEFTKLAVRHGTTGIVADPHELTNVCGIAGAEYIAKAFSLIKCGDVNPIDVYLQLPSCVPATPFETSGAVLTGEDTAREIRRELFHGLGEMMNYPGVVGGDADTLRKLTAAQSEHKVIDGHAPGLTGDSLNAYIASGIATDHECMTRAEAEEKVARGLYCHLRHGSSAHNLEKNLQAVTDANFRRFLLCTDDRNASDLLTKGYLDDALKTAVSCGMDPVRAVTLATLNAAECYRLCGKGAVAPGYDADLVIVKDLQEFEVLTVLKRGVTVYAEGKERFDVSVRYLPDTVKNTVRVAAVTADSFRLAVRSEKLHAMEMLPHNLVTKDVIVSVRSENGDVALSDDLLKLAVVERHFATGNIGLGIVKGFGFRGGALGISVAHDSHNLIVLGDSNEAMAKAVRALERIGGGMVLIGNDKERVLPLDIAGLMSSLPAEEVARRSGDLSARAKEMGVRDGYEPFMSLAFLSLAVIPELKLTDRGLFDVRTFSFMNIED